MASELTSRVLNSNTLFEILLFAFFAFLDHFFSLLTIFSRQHSCDVYF
jgi:hypothetical protein